MQLKSKIPLMLSMMLLFSCNNTVKTEQQKSEIPTKDNLASAENMQVNEAPKITLPNYPFEVEGQYLFVNTIAGCRLELNLEYTDNQIVYKMKTNTRTKTGHASIDYDETDKTYWIALHNFEWYENLGTIDPEGSEEYPKPDLPQEIGAYIDSTGISFQNYGNAANYYVIIKECDTKFIDLVRQ